MEWLARFLEWLSKVFGADNGPTAPTGPTGGTVVTGPSGPAVTAVTKATPFRSVPRITQVRLGEILRDYPMAREVPMIFAATKGNPLPVAQSWMESRYGQDTIALETKNPLGLLAPGTGKFSTGVKRIQIPTGVIEFLIFPSWSAAFAEWQARMDDPTYKGGVYMPEGMRLEQMIVTYVGGPGCWSSRGATCANGETWESCQHYLTETMDRLNRYLGIGSGPVTGATGISPPPQGWTAHTLSGTTAKLWLPSDIRFRVKLTPVGPNRSGRSLVWTGSTQHETGNERPGANAEMHSNWQDAGTPGHPDGKIGVHFYSDDEEIIQKIPVNEQGVHSGDWRNGQHTAIERCVDSGSNFARSQRIAAYLQAGLLRINGWGAVEHLHPHRTKPGSGCPVYIGQDWPGYERQVDRAIAEHVQ